MAVLGEKTFNQHSMFGMTEEDWVSDGCGAWIWVGEQMRTARKQSTGIVLASPSAATSTHLSPFFLSFSFFLFPSPEV